MCSWHCSTCTGPDAADCVDCFPHAHGSNCACDDNWGGMDCEVYLGPCPPQCNGCTGPTAMDCVHCAEFAAYVVDNDTGFAQCQCLNFPNWGPADTCRNFYQGHCHETCLDRGAEVDDCWGPDPFQCYECGPHSYRTVNGDCICEEYWNGEADCSVYSGPCDPVCIGCNGPYPYQCNACQGNATVDGVTGNCTCNEGWTGADCMEWAGLCHCTCKSCDSDSCYECKEHSHYDGGSCTCDAGWTDASCCTVYEGTCAPTCHSGCVRGSNPNDCDDCILHAHRALNGDCVCDRHWGGANCQSYNGPCDCKCNGHCYGPGADECDGCGPNAVTNNGFCVCDAHWGNDCCTDYTG